MPSLAEDQALARSASFTSIRAHETDWIEVAAATVRTTIAQEEGQGQAASYNDEERIAFSRRVVESVINHPGELAVFYQNKPIEGFHLFNAIVPDPENPFQVTLNLGEDHDHEKAAYELSLNYSKGESILGYSDFPSAKYISYADGEHRTLYTVGGPGSGPKDVAPDAYFKQYDPLNYDIAIGASAVGALFDRLHETPTDKDMLFGSLVQVALLAADFKAPTPKVSAFGEEIATAQTRLAAEIDVANVAISTNRVLHTQAKKLSASVTASRQTVSDLVEARDEIAPIRGVYRFVVSDQDIDDYPVRSTGVRQLNEIVGRAEKENTEFAKRLHRFQILQGIVDQLPA